MASRVPDSRFKTLPVKKRCSIKAFVEEHSLSFSKGRGFYQLNKAEFIQDYKEVIVRRRTDRAFLTGDSVRDVLGIPASSKKFKLDLEDIEDFDVFVQSTSVNRVLLPGTEFLYEVDKSSADGTKAPIIVSYKRIANSFFVLATQFTVILQRTFSHCCAVVQLEWKGK